MSLAARVTAAADQGGPRFLDRRFDSAGAVVSCPGNTVIAHIYDTAVLDILTDAQARLAETEAGGCFAWLPRASLHCTQFNGLIYAERSAAHWPSGLAVDATRAAADAFMRDAFESTEVPDTPFVVTPTRFYGQADDALGLGLTATDTANPGMRAYRNALAAAAGLAHRPGHADYEFHITFAYLIRWPSIAAAEAFDAVTDTVLADVKAALPNIGFDQSEFCHFEGMTHFAVQSAKPLAR